MANMKLNEELRKVEAVAEAAAIEKEIELRQKRMKENQKAQERLEVLKKQKSLQIEVCNVCLLFILNCQRLLTTLGSTFHLLLSLQEQPTIGFEAAVPGINRQEMKHPHDVSIEPEAITKETKIESVDRVDEDSDIDNDVPVLRSKLTPSEGSILVRKMPDLAALLQDHRYIQVYLLMGPMACCFLIAM